jgi:hypothetical protein
VLATAIVSVIPYVNLIVGVPILWTITACFYQRAINRLVAADSDPAYSQTLAGMQ